MRTTKIQKYRLREAIETSLERIGVSSAKKMHFLNSFFAVLNTLSNNTPLSAFNHDFFDFKRSARIHARQEKISFNRALEQIIASPAIVFEIMDMLPEPPPEKDQAAEQCLKKPFKRAARVKSPARPKHGTYIPTDQQIADAALNVKFTTGSFPDNSSGHDGLPEGSIGWFRILKLLPMRDLTVRKLVKQVYPHIVTRPSILPYKKSEIALDDVKDSCLATVRETGCRVRVKDGIIKYGALADGKTTWAAVDMGFVHGRRGLGNLGYTSLADFQNKNNIGMDNGDQSLRKDVFSAPVYPIPPACVYT